MTTNWAVAAAIALIFSSSIAIANEIYVTNIGDDTKLEISQQGENNTIANSIASHSTITGDRNEMLIKQKNTGQTTTGGAIHFDVTGDDNSVELGQGYNLIGLHGTDTTESGAKFIELSVLGDNNAVHVGQRNGSLGVYDGHDTNIDITGDNNNVYSEQTLDGKKALSIDLYGNGHSVSTTQQSTGAHTSAIDLTNGGGAYTMSVTQNSNIAQSYTLTGTCYVAGGCAVSVTQN
jgi:hypothetical protein